MYKFRLLLITISFASLVLSSGCRTLSSPSSKPAADASIRSCIDSQAIVNYLEKDYFTEQQHIFCPHQKSLTINSLEPGGAVQWKFQGQQYSVEGTSRIQGVMDSYWSKTLGIALYDLMIYGGGFQTSQFPKETDNVHIDGILYRKIIPNYNDLKEFGLYRNLSNNKIDLAIGRDHNGILWMIKSYNWSYFYPANTLIPRKIDFFDISNGISSKQLKIQVEYKTVK